VRHSYPEQTTSADLREYNDRGSKVSVRKRDDILGILCSGTWCDVPASLAKVSIDLGVCSSVLFFYTQSSNL